VGSISTLPRMYQGRGDLHGRQLCARGGGDRGLPVINVFPQQRIHPAGRHNERGVNADT
jgi:hypothetical protein